jgi:hypothetical protein
MAANSGGGAATAAGISYQSKVAAYFLATAICDFDAPATRGRRIKAMAFETREPIDDVNLSFHDGSRAHIQAKTNVTLSFAPTAALHAVFEQFIGQFESGTVNTDYMLVTSSKSSARLRRDASLALESFRLASDSEFARNQPSWAVNVMSELLCGISDMLRARRADPEESAKAILRRTYIVTLDLDSDAPLEEAVVALLASQKYTSPHAFWSKLIVDCLEHAKAHRSISLDDAKKSYSRFVAPAPTQERELQSELFTFRFALDTDSTPVGREVVLIEWNDHDEDATILLAELFRFDEDCNPAVTFDNQHCIFGDGTPFKLFRRTATLALMLQYLDENPEVVEGRAVVHAPSRGDADIESGLCADRHRDLIRRAIAENDRPGRCIHCTDPVTSSVAYAVEVQSRGTLRVGIVHNNCIEPDFRIFERVRMSLFEEYRYLNKFDIEGFFRMRQGLLGDK